MHTKPILDSLDCQDCLEHSFWYCQLETKANAPQSVEGRARSIRNTLKEKVTRSSQYPDAGGCQERRFQPYSSRDWCQKSLSVGGGGGDSGQPTAELGSALVLNDGVRGRVTNTT